MEENAPLTQPASSRQRVAEQRASGRREGGSHLDRLKLWAREMRSGWAHVSKAYCVHWKDSKTSVRLIEIPVEIPMEMKDSKTTVKRNAVISTHWRVESGCCYTFVIQ
jgi:hypothetical protein